jgi:hypothetical protein
VRFLVKNRVELLYATSKLPLNPKFSICEPGHKRTQANAVRRIAEALVI